MTEKQKIMAVASVGGHFVQLLTITKALEKHYEIIYCSTHDNCRDLIGEREYYLMEDFNRKTPWKLMAGFIKQVRMIKEKRPVA
ncbi:MAG: oligosaccharide biosynthesis protein Alg14, partial [Muribaculaceae bacterium]|nr:oligosaccharide biosynthesis protein Alg14 [Muribaculaceae bacterium]